MAIVNAIFESDWQNPQTYQWMLSLPRLGWAWEFLRRNPDFRTDWNDQIRECCIERTGPAVVATNFSALDPVCARWGLVFPFATPDMDARIADVLWSTDACTSVLSVFAISDASGRSSPAVPLAKLDCRTSIFIDGVGREHTLFAKEGRCLQLEMCGGSILTARRLLSDTPPPPGKESAHVLSQRRLADLIKYEGLRPSLYPSTWHCRRLALVLQVLDGALQEAPQRDIALVVFGEGRVCREWDKSSHMRDRIRRAIHRGRALMDGGYRSLLKER